MFLSLYEDKYIGAYNLNMNLSLLEKTVREKIATLIA